MLIHDVKFDIRDNPILQNSSQEPSMSSKYDCVLDALLIMLGSWKSAYNSIMTYDGYCDVKCYTKYDQILQSSSQELSMSHNYDFVLDVLLIMIGS